MTPQIYAGLSRLDQLEYINSASSRLINTVCDFYGFSVKDVRSPARTSGLVECRVMICHLLHKYTKLTLKQIGKEVGGRDHTTVIYSLRTFEDRYMLEKSFRKKADAIQSEINKKSDNTEYHDNQ